jgi:hypothetical protein
MNIGLLKIHWQSRIDALSPCAMLVFDSAAIALAKKMMSFEDEKLHPFQGVRAKKMMLIMGDGESLPWTNGAVYLGRDTEAPAVLLPTTLKPNVPLDLFERALYERFRKLSPFAVLPEKIIPFGTAKTLSRNILEKWLSENQ